MGQDQCGWVLVAEATVGHRRVRSGRVILAKVLHQSANPRRLLHDLISGITKEMLEAGATLK